MPILPVKIASAGTTPLLTPLLKNVIWLANQHPCDVLLSCKTVWLYETYYFLKTTASNLRHPLSQNEGLFTASLRRWNWDSGVHWKAEKRRSFLATLNLSKHARRAWLLSDFKRDDASQFLSGIWAWLEGGNSRCLYSLLFEHGEKVQFGALAKTQGKIYQTCCLCGCVVSPVTVLSFQGVVNVESIENLDGSFLGFFSCEEALMMMEENHLFHYTLFRSFWDSRRRDPRRCLKHLQRCIELCPGFGVAQVYMALWKWRVEQDHE